MDEKKNKTSRVKEIGTKIKANYKGFSKDWKEMSIKHPVGTGFLEAGGIVYVTLLGTIVGMLTTGHKISYEIIKVR